MDYYHDRTENRGVVGGVRGRPFKGGSPKDTAAGSCVAFGRESPAGDTWHLQNKGT